MLLAACGGANADANANGNAGNTSGNDVSSSEDTTSSGDNNDSDEAMESEDMMEGMMMEEVVSSDAVLDPALSSDEGVLAASMYLYDRLPDGLAAEITVSDDGLTYEVRLRANAVFSDGAPVTSDVVAANFNRWYDPADSLHGDGAYDAWLMYFEGFLGELDADGQPVSKFDGVEKVDALNFLLHLNEPMDDLLDILAMPQFSILSPDALASAGYGTQGGSVVGSGAYVVGSWDADGLILVPSATYWGTAAEGEVSFPSE
jgi:ABC-type transport system substrate-binding protein